MIRLKKNLRIILGYKTTSIYILGSLTNSLNYDIPKHLLIIHIFYFIFHFHFHPPLSPAKKKKRIIIIIMCINTFIIIFHMITLTNSLLISRRLFLLLLWSGFSFFPFFSFGNV